MEDELTFGIVQHKDDEGKVSTGMCCWNDDTDGVLPLDGEYAAPSSTEARATAAEDARETALKALLTGIDDAFENYERFGAVCMFEDQPMIHANVLTEIIDLRGQYHIERTTSPSQEPASGTAANQGE
jgi:hypothetical protein